MKKLIRRHGELHLIDRNYKNHCSIYLYVDYTVLLGWLSFIFCNSINPYRARKSIRLDYCNPVAITPTHPIFRKNKYWDINKDGYDKILINILSQKNSQFPNHTNWEKIRILYMKYDDRCHELWWKSNFYYNCDMPDYTQIWGICNWYYLDEDPDNAHPIGYDEKRNISVWSTHINGFGILVFDDCIRMKAKRVAKLSIFAPEYIEYTSSDYACWKSSWKLSTEDKRAVIKLLKRQANWGRVLSNIDMAGAFLIVENGKQITSVYNIPQDLPIPDYMQLPE